MNAFDWLIVVVPLLLIFRAAFHSRKYIRSGVDFLAAGRVAGRYTICVGDLASGLSIITLIALTEQNYQSGFGMSFWNAISFPVWIALGLTGFCTYRWRQTRCLSKGQFIEMRYGSKAFRVVVAVVSTAAEAITNAIGPAIATKFFIYYLGLPHKIMLLGIPVPCYGIIVVLCITLAIMLIWPSGRLSLLLTDCFQGLLTYPIFLIFAGFILLKFSWNVDVLPALVARAPEQSFLDPHHLREFRDFNIFMISVNLFSSVMNRASWFGNDSTNSGRTPHEQKMGGLLGYWRGGFSTMTMVLIALLVYVFMTNGNFGVSQNTFGFSNNEVRRELTSRIMDELAVDRLISREQKENIEARIQVLPDVVYACSRENPISQIPNDTYQDGSIKRRQIFVRKSDGKVVDEMAEDGSVIVCQNLDKRYFDAVYEEVGDTPEGRHAFQQYCVKYRQMMMPMCLRRMLPWGLRGLFCLLAIMLLISTDDTRIFNAVGSIVQDIVLPCYKRRITPQEHVSLLRTWTVIIGVFFFVVSMFFAQMDYISMFITVMCSLWLGAAGPIMLGGLYTRFGNLTGAWCAVFFGSGSALLGIFGQFRWAKTIYPWLERHGMVETVGQLLEKLSRPFHPYVQWQMNAVRFPINAYEIFFFSMVLSIIAYTAGSYLTYKPYNLDKLLHRGKYADPGEAEKSSPLSAGHLPVMRRVLYYIRFALVGIDNEYTLGDKCIAYGVFVYTMIYQFGLVFLGTFIYTKYYHPWDDAGWGTYFQWTQVIVPAGMGVVTAVWFILGTIRDLKQLYRDLAARRNDASDTGQVFE